MVVFFSRAKQQQASTATSGVKSPTRSASSSTSKCTSEQNSGSKEGRPPPPVAGLSSTSEPRQSKVRDALQDEFVFVLPYKPVEVDLPILMDGCGRVWLHEQLY